MSHPHPPSVPLTRRPELQGLILLALLSAAVAGFLVIAGEVREGDTHAFDNDILLFFRTTGDPANPIGPFWVEAVMRDLTALGGYTVLGLLTLIVSGYLLIRGKRASALLVWGAIAGGALVSNVLKFGFDRPRPDVVAHLVDVHSLSFPSGHAMISAVTYLTLGALLSRTEKRFAVRAYLMGVAIALTLLIGFSRIYLGVHYPTDVLAGWCAGAAWAAGCWLLARYLQHRGEVEPSD